MKTSDFYYDLPQELIAQTPLERRDSSRLLHLDKTTGELEHRHFYELLDYLREGDCMIFNDSRVLPARLIGARPTGGSVTPGSMLPLMLFSVAYGAGPGLLAGLVYGVLQYLQGGWWLNVWQFLLDYILAFTVLGLAGIAHNKSEKWMYLSIPFAALMRALCAFLAGLMWVADTPVSELVIGNWQFSTPVTYSLVYNGAYLIPDTLICLLMAALVGKRLLKAIKGN